MNKEEKILKILVRLHNSSSKEHKERDYYIADAYVDVLETVFEDLKRSFPSTFSTAINVPIWKVILRMINIWT